jgi:hypothetical protein
VVLPATSFTVQVRSINPETLQSSRVGGLSAYVTSSNEDGVQLSDALVTFPVTDGSILYEQSEALQTVTVGGTVKSGGSSSFTDTV